jgi:hypothetical protein
MAKDKNKEAAKASDDGVLSAQLEEYAGRSSGRIQAQVSSFRDGLQVYNNISIVRVLSRDTNLLIMEDYMPIIGEIDGTVDFIGKEFVQTLEGVRGFFCHDHNVFFLLLKDVGQAFESKTQTAPERDEAAQADSFAAASLGSNSDSDSVAPVASAAAVEAHSEREPVNA